MLLRFAHSNWMTFLKNLVNRDKRLERLNLVGKNRLPVTKGRMSVSVSNTFVAIRSTQLMTYTFMPAQKAADDLWSHV